MAVSKRWKEPEEAYRQWHKEGGDLPFGLGEVDFVSVGPGIWVGNLIGQQGIRRAGGEPPVRYDAIRRGLGRVAMFAGEKSASVHMPRIGCGLSGGSWEVIEPLIEATLISKGVEVTVYDFG